MVSVTAVVLKQPWPGKATHFMDDCFVNLGENVILTLRWQSGASESATVCFGISLSICYWLLRVCVCVCVCVRVWEREREGVTSQHISYLYRGLCVCVWDWETVTSQQSVQLVRNRLNRGLCTNTYELHHCVCHATLFPFRAWTDAKLRTLLTVFITFWMLKLAIMKGALHFQCGVWCSANHNALCQLANQSRRKEGLCRKHLREAGHRGTTIMYSIWNMCFFIFY